MVSNSLITRLRTVPSSSDPFTVKYTSNSCCKFNDPSPSHRGSRSDLADPELYCDHQQRSGHAQNAATTPVCFTFALSSPRSVPEVLSLVEIVD